MVIVNAPLRADLFREKADSLFDESKKGLLRREIPLTAGNARPIQGRRVNGIVTGLASHQGQGGTGIVLYHLELLPVVRPCHDIAMATDGGQPERMRLVQIRVNPLLVELVGCTWKASACYVPSSQSVAGFLPNHQ